MVYLTVMPDSGNASPGPPKTYKSGAVTGFIMNKSGLKFVGTFILLLAWVLTSLTFLLRGALLDDNFAGIIGAVVFAVPMLYIIYKVGCDEQI